MLPAASATGIDALAQAWIAEARRSGFDTAAIRGALEHALTRNTCDSVAVQEPEPELREILVAELAEALPTRVCGTDSLTGHSTALVVSLAARASRTASGPESACVDIWLQANSAIDLIRSEAKPAPDALVTFISRSPTLLRLAEAMLSSSGWDPGGLVLRDARVPGWKRGLKSVRFAVADTVVARELPPTVPLKRLRLISPASLDEVRAALAAKM
ncbi:MAG: hypothetical protein SGI92_32360 [Bryobacteraceae bacterium]|nr:hypothetical protein [Bryobacteraceae bacterium]